MVKCLQILPNNIKSNSASEKVHVTPWLFMFVAKATKYISIGTNLNYLPLQSFNLLELSASGRFDVWKTNESQDWTARKSRTCVTVQRTFSTNGRIGTQSVNKQRRELMYGILRIIGRAYCSPYILGGCFECVTWHLSDLGIWKLINYQVSWFPPHRGYIYLWIHS